MDNSLNICSISLDGFKKTGFYQEDAGIFDLEKISKINIFIGKNNSGKSRLIRETFKKDINQLNDHSHNIHDLIKKLKTSVNTDIKANFNNSSLYYQYEPIIEEIHEHLKNYNSYNNKLIKFIAPHDGTSFFNLLSKFDRQYVQEIYKIWETIIEETQGEEKYITTISKILSTKVSKIYIPMLRGLRHLDTDKTNFYLNKICHDYFPKDILNNIEDYDSNAAKKIFTGLEIYQELQHKLLGKPQGRHQVKDYEDFLSKNFFNNEIITLIPSLESQCVEIKIGEADQFPIYHLGDGLQTIIIVTFPIFMADESTLFFIEEPDLAMHPSMQRALIQIMLEKSLHQYFLTTHSNHFLDMALESDDISIFQVQKEPINNQETKFKITYANNLLKSIYQDLGIKNSSVLLANCTIWVEGITDKLYLKAYMKKYLQHLEKTEPKKYDTYKNFKEDLHYIFAEYQGSNIVHWNFGADELENTKTNVEALCGTALLIADGDIKDKGSRVADLTQIMGERFILLDAKEIENYIPKVILTETASYLFEKVFKKKEKAEINLCIEEKIYFHQSIAIGEYLETFIKNPPDGRKFFQDTSGTIIEKVRFCEIACRIMQSNTEWQLTPQLTELCEKIFQHINTNNPQ